MPGTHAVCKKAVRKGLFAKLRTALAYTKIRTFKPIWKNGVIFALMWFFHTYDYALLIVPTALHQALHQRLISKITQAHTALARGVNAQAQADKAAEHIVV